MVRDIIPSQNVTWDDIRDTLNSANGSVNNNVTSAFQKAANINMWSKHKPVKHLKLFPTDYNYLKEAKYGLTVPAMVHPVDNGKLTNNVWQYEIPSADSDAKRLGDFRNYNPNAIPCITCEFPSSIGFLNGEFITTGNLYIGLDDMGKIGFDTDTMVNFRDFATDAMLNSYLCLGVFPIDFNGVMQGQYYMTSDEKIIDYINKGDYGFITIPNWKENINWNHFINYQEVYFRLFLTESKILGSSLPSNASYSLECEKYSDRKSIVITQVTVIDYIEATIEFTIERIDNKYARYASINISCRRTGDGNSQIPFTLNGGSDYSVNAPLLKEDYIMLDNSGTWSRSYLAAELSNNKLEYQSGIQHTYYLDMRSNDNAVMIKYIEKQITL